MTHLILHKVRGEPAFDVAEQMENGWWIIPTSGHRAYPYKWWPMDEVWHHGYDQGPERPHYQDSLPTNWPDHYSINDEKPKPPTPKPTTSRSTPTLDDVD